MKEIKTDDCRTTVGMPYGIRDDKPVHISEVSKGMACGCTCPGCRADLIARKGDVMRHHFAHVSGSDCGLGLETGLHLAAKDILAKRGEIALPAACVTFEGGKPYIEVSEQGIYAVTNVRLEKGIGGIIPDVLVEIDGKPFAIEIFVTHRVGNEKIKRLRELDLSAIEIDLSMLDRDLGRNKLESIVVDLYDQKSWLFNSEVAKREKEVRFQTKTLEIISRGPMSHADYCPIPMREYQGKPYANVIDDCVGCPHCLEITDGSVICDAHLGLNSRIKDTSILIWNGNPREASFFIKDEFYPMVWVDSVSRKRDGTILFSGNNLKYRTRETYSTKDVEGIVDTDTGEIIEIHEWLNAITRGRVGVKTSC